MTTSSFLVDNGYAYLVTRTQDGSHTNAALARISLANGYLDASVLDCVGDSIGVSISNLNTPYDGLRAMTVLNDQHNNLSMTGSTLLPKLRALTICSATLTEVHQPSGQNAWSFRLFPNPVHQVLHLELDQQQEQDLTVQIFNATGQCIQQQRMQRSTSLTIDCRSLTKGLYWVRIEEPSKQRFVLQKFVKN